MSEPQLSTVKSVGDLMTAQLIRAHLEDAGIQVFLPEEHQSALGELVPVLGGLRIQVPTSELERAQSILAEIERESGVDRAHEGYGPDGAEMNRRATRAFLIFAALAFGAFVWAMLQSA